MEANQLATNLPHSTTNPKYLESNSTSHVWVFGAVAELIDNSIDAKALRLDITMESFNKVPALIFLDNGVGMQAKGMHLMLSFGHCSKGEEDIGRYGNGFKSGSMRVGMDVLVFSRRDNVLTLGFLSQTFLYATNAPEVLVPILSWDAKTHELQSNSTLGHNSKSSLDVVFTYSPFKSLEDLFSVFSRINTESGTCIIIYNLKKQGKSEKYELDFTDHYDIRIRNHSINTSHPKEYYSLRAYCAILYLQPVMAIYLRGRKVKSIRISSTLLVPKKYQYTSKKGGQSTQVVFGFVPKEEDKAHYGVMMYYNNRLIKSYVPVGSQLVTNNSKGKSIIGVVQANWLQPTHNKQDFFLGQNKAKQYDLLIQALGERLKQYWLDIGIDQKGIGAFTKEIWSKEPKTKKSKTTGKGSSKATTSKKGQIKSQPKKKNISDDESESEEENSNPTVREEKDKDNTSPAERNQELSQSLIVTQPAVSSPTQLIPTSLFPPACSAPRTQVPIKIEKPEIDEKRMPVSCAACFKWRLVPVSLANHLPDEWTCKDNKDPEHNYCEAPEEDPEGEIPKAARRKDIPVPEIPLEDQIDDLKDELDVSRTQFSKKDRAKERKLLELERKLNNSMPPPTYREDILGKLVHIYWRTHNQWFPGKISNFIATKGTHKVVYKDGDEENLRLDDEMVYFEDSSIPPILPPIILAPKKGPKVVFPVTIENETSRTKSTSNLKNNQESVAIQRIPKAKKSVAVQVDLGRLNSTNRESSDHDRDKDRDRGRGRDKDGRKGTEVTVKRERSKSPERTPTKRPREESVPKDLNKKIESSGNLESVERTELLALRASIKKFLQLQYPINSTEAETPEEKVANVFVDHVNKMEVEEILDLN